MSRSVTKFGGRRRRLARVLIATSLLAGLVVFPAGPAGAVPIFPGNPGELQVTFDNTGEPSFITGLAATGVGAFRMDTGPGTGDEAGGKVFLHLSELDDQPVTSLTSLSFQYFIETTSASSQQPYVNIRVDGPAFDGPRTLTNDISGTPGTVGDYTTRTAPTGATDGWAATGAGNIVCNGTDDLGATFSLQELHDTCGGTTIVATSLGRLGGISIVTGVGNGTTPPWAGWIGVIDDVRINANVYDLEPTQVTITPASPVTLPNAGAQTVSFTLQASGWNSFAGTDTTGFADRVIFFNGEIAVDFTATGATATSGSTGTFPSATTIGQLQGAPPPVTFDLNVTAALIGNVNAIDVNWTGTNAVPNPATTVLQLPGTPATGGDLLGLVDPQSGLWSLRAANGAVTSFFYGNPGDVPMAGDWDCDGVDTPGLYRQSDGFVYLRNSNTQGIADIRFFFGNPGDIPLAGDFNADGCDTVSIYRPSEARIYVINELGANNGGLGPADFSYIFGNPADKPFVGDFNGDGTDTVGLHRETTGIVYFRQTNTQGIADAEFFFGDPGDRFVSGDWGVIDGIDTPGVFRPLNSTFYLRYTNTQGIAEETVVFGDSTHLPVAGKWTP